MIVYISTAGHAEDSVQKPFLAERSSVAHCKILVFWEKICFAMQARDKSRFDFSWAKYEGAVNRAPTRCAAFIRLRTPARPVS